MNKNKTYESLIKDYQSGKLCSVFDTGVDIITENNAKQVSDLIQREIISQFCIETRIRMANKKECALSDLLSGEFFIATSGVALSIVGTPSLLDSMLIGTGYALGGKGFVKCFIKYHQAVLITNYAKCILNEWLQLKEIPQYLRDFCFVNNIDVFRDVSGLHNNTGYRLVDMRDDNKILKSTVMELVQNKKLKKFSDKYQQIITDEDCNRNFDYDNEDNGLY